MITSTPALRHSNLALQCTRKLRRPLAALLLTILTAFNISAVKVGEYAVKLVGITPEPGSTVSTLDSFTLHFDMSDFFEKSGNIDDGTWGVAQIYEDIYLYKGEGTSGEKIAQSTAMYDQYTDEFVPGPDMTLSLDQPTRLIPGEKYTLSIGSMFCIAQKNKSNSTIENGSMLNLYGIPQLYTYTASADLEAEFDDLYILTPENNSSIDELTELIITFEEDVFINDDPVATFVNSKTSSDAYSSSSISIDSDNPTRAIISFSPQTLYNGTTYNLTIPEGAFSPVSDPTKLSKKITATYKGAAFHEFGINTLTPENGLTILPSMITLRPDFPQGTGFTYLSKQPTYDIRLYKGNDTTGEPLASFVGEISSNLYNTVEYDINYEYEPGTEYTFVVDDDLIKAYEIGGNGKYLTDYKFKGTELHYTTLGRDEIPSLEFLSATIEEGAELELLDRFEIKFAPYTVNGQTYSLGAGKTNRWSLLDVTGGQEKEVKNSTLTYKTDYVLDFSLKTTLYAGHDYRIVIPAGAVSIANKFVSGFIANDEITLNFKGATDPVGMAVNGSSIAADSELNALSIVAFHLPTNAEATKNATMKLISGETTIKEATLSVANSGKTAMAIADFSDADHTPFTPEAATAYTVVMPEGSVTGPDGVLTNPEQTVAFKGMTPAPVTEFVNVDYTVGGYASTAFSAPKDGTLTVAVTPEAGWEIDALTLDGNDVTADIADGLYTTPALTADSQLALTLRYADLLYTEDEMSGTVTPEGTTLKAWSENGCIIVEGIEKDDLVSVYNLSGATLVSFRATNSRSTIELPAGEVYIVRVNETAMKLLNK